MCDEEHIIFLRVCCKSAYDSYVATSSYLIKCKSFRVS